MHLTPPPPLGVTEDGSRRDQVAKFIEQATLLQGLEHPNILAVLGVSVEDNVVPIVLYPISEHGNLHIFMERCRVNPHECPLHVSVCVYMNVYMLLLFCLLLFVCLLVHLFGCSLYYFLLSCLLVHLFVCLLLLLLFVCLFLCLLVDLLVYFLFVCIVFLFPGSLACFRVCLLFVYIFGFFIRLFTSMFACCEILSDL